MTDYEFKRQIWRPYDSVDIGDGVMCPVLNVCFTTRSVRVNLPSGGAVWLKCDDIVSHKSSRGEASDDDIIENLHNELMKEQERNENLRILIERMRPYEDIVGELKKSCNILFNAIHERRSTLSDVERALNKIDKAIDKMNGNGDNDNSECSGGTD